MSIEKVKEIDAIGIDNNTGYVTLSIIDSTDWQDEQQHLILLQEKINIYLSFIESGEIYESYPDAKGRDIEIKIHFKHDITNNCEQFLTKATDVIKGVGFDLKYLIA
jgi:hypothetical protein